MYNLIGRNTIEYAHNTECTYIKIRIGTDVFKKKRDNSVMSKAHMFQTN